MINPTIYSTEIPFHLLLKIVSRIIVFLQFADKNCASLLQDAYVDAVKQKIRTLESRIAQSELLLPQLEWRRQAYMEDTVSALTNKVAFLNRRFDELLPQFRAKFPETIA